MQALQLKQRSRRISIAREVAEIDRLRTGYERKLTTQLYGWMEDVADQASAEYASTQNYRSERMERELGQILLPHYREVLREFSERTFKNITERYAKLDFDNLVQEFVREHGGKRIRNIWATTRKKVMREIARGEDKGLGVREIAANIRGNTSIKSKLRAATIARTETHMAANYANHAQSLDMLPSNTMKQWVSVSDNRTRHYHAAMNGVKVPIDEPFKVMTNGVEKLMQHPGDPAGGAANVINCRCAVIYIEPDDFVLDEPTVEDVPVVPERVNDFVPTPSTDVQIDVTRAAAVKKTLDMLKDAATDERYSMVPRFGGAWKGGRFVGRASKFDEVIEMILPSVIAETNELATLFNVPKIRGLEAIRRKNVNMEMGDGIMGINNKLMLAKINSKERSSWTRGGNWELNKRQRSWSVSFYTGSGYDRFRSTVFHEFGHQVHQYYNVSKMLHEEGLRSLGRNWKPPVELSLKQLKGKRDSRQGPSLYSDTNEKEWFAENFSAWFMGYREIVDPDFVPLIRKLIDEAN